MIRLKTFKNSYIKLKEDYDHAITKEEYELKILDEAVEKLKSEKAIFYTHEEFWKIVREGMKRDYETISHNIRGKYA